MEQSEIIKRLEAVEQASKNKTYQKAFKMLRKVQAIAENLESGLAAYDEALFKGANLIDKANILSHLEMMLTLIKRGDL